MHENDVELHSDEDEEFEATALEFQDKFRQLNGKFQEILMQESTVSLLLTFNLLNGLFICHFSIIY